MVIVSTRQHVSGFSNVFMFESRFEKEQEGFFFSFSLGNVQLNLIDNIVRCVGSFVLVKVKWMMGSKAHFLHHAAGKRDWYRGIKK